MSRRATAWVLLRRDGKRIGFTEHDESLVVDGVVCRPQSGFLPSEAETRLGFSHDNAALQGVLDDVSLSVEDLKAGLYDGAWVQTWRVDWTGATQPKLQRTQRILSVTRDSSRRFTAEIVGLGAELETVQGRVVSRLCGAKFGDARCGIDASNHPEGTSCARTFAACKTFANAANYRGFPHLIGEDALVQGVNEALPRDGGSRYGDFPDV